MRNRSSTLLASLCLVTGGLAFAACDAEIDDDADLDDVDTEFDSPAAEVDEAELEPEELHSADFEAGEGAMGQIDGEMHVVERAGTLELIVDLDGLTPGEHAWHLHEGNCGAAGPVRIAFSSTNDMDGTSGHLTANADGEAERTIAVPRLDRTWIDSDQYSVHVHHGAGTDPGPTVACANL